MVRILFVAVVLLMSTVEAAELAVGPRLQESSVAIKKSYSDVGSGTIILRTIEGKQVAWVLTAAHVIDNLRSVETVIAPDGTERKQVTYKDAELMQQIRQGGRPVRQILDFAKVVSVDKQRDIGLLRVRADGGYSQGAIFWLEEGLPAVGTLIYHVASPGGGNLNDASVTAGIVAQVGRSIEEFGGAEAVYDQSDAGALPGSSGGMIALQSDGRWIGMITLGLRGTDSFHYFVPIRRVREWAKTINALWLLDPKEKQPTEDELLKIPLENTPVAFNRPKSGSAGGAASIETMELPILDRPRRLSELEQQARP